MPASLMRAVRRHYLSKCLDGQVSKTLTKTTSGVHMKLIRSRFSGLLLTAASAFFGTSYLYAQELVLDVTTTVGTSSPVSEKQTVAAGSEVLIHTGPIYRIFVVPTVLATGEVALAMKVFDATSSSTAPLMSPTMTIAQGQEATMVRGTLPPSANNLKVQITPRLK